MNNQSNIKVGFESDLWDIANKLRAQGNVEAYEYRKVVIGLIFLKYISDAFNFQYEKLVAEGDGDEEDRDYYTAENIFFVPKEARWENIAANAHTPEIGKIIDDAMNIIEKDNASLKGVLPKNYASPELDKKVLGDVVDLFTNIHMHDMNEEKDILGRTYEYFIEKFASIEGKDGGEYYTPPSIVRLIVEILKPYKGRVYDPACGSGGMFVQSAKFIKEHSGNIADISIYGQEKTIDTWKMAKMNLIIRGIDGDFGTHPANTLLDDLHPTVKMDYIMANPPFNVKDWGLASVANDVRWKYGTPPNSNANYAWIQHMISHLAPDGKIGLVMANGSLSTNQSGEGDIRKNIIEADLVEGIIALPTNLFYSVTLPACLWFVTKNKKQKGKTVFIDARKVGELIDRKHRVFSNEDIKSITKVFEDFQNGTLEDEKGFCAVVETAEIAKQDYMLTPGRYVGIEDQEDDGEPFEEKMGRLTSELSEMFARSHELEAEIKERLGAIGFDIE